MSNVEKATQTPTQISTQTTTVTTGGKRFVVKSVFNGKQHLNTVLLKLASQKAIDEMDL